MIHFINNVLHSFVKNFKCDSYCSHYHLSFSVFRCSDNKVSVKTQVHWYKNKVTVPGICRILKRCKQSTIGFYRSRKLHKQSHEVFCKNKCSKQLSKFHRKTPVLESPLGLHGCNFTKMKLVHRCFPVKFAKFLRSLIFEGHLRTPVSEN